MILFYAVIHQIFSLIFSVSLSGGFCLSISAGVGEKQKSLGNRSSLCLRACSIKGNRDLAGTFNTLKYNSRILDLIFPSAGIIFSQNVTIIINTKASATRFSE